MSHFYTPDQLTKLLKESTFRAGIIHWVKHTLRPLENNDRYLSVARRGKVTDVNTDVFAAVDVVMKPFVLRGTPAHCHGHHNGDAIGGSAIIASDPFIATGYPNDVYGALFGLLYHDCSTGVQHRYIDFDWELDHGAIGAWIFYHATEGLISKEIRLLGAYGINTHPHLRNKVKTKDGRWRHVWNDHLFYENGHPVRLAVWLARWADRLENAGASHFYRHIMAAVDGARVKGFDLSGTEYFAFDKSLPVLFTPQLGNVDGVPTLLQHLKGYADSATAFPCSVYNQHDHLSPSMSRLVALKAGHSNQIINATVTHTGDKPANFDTLAQMLAISAGQPVTQINLDTITLVEQLWNQTKPEDQARWASTFDLAKKLYYAWLNTAKSEIEIATSPLIQDISPLVSSWINEIS